jgi:hypothetical protein
VVRPLDGHSHPLNRMRALRSSLICLFLWSAGFAHGEGVLVYKNQAFHSDKAAYALRYDRIEGEGFVTWVIVGKERKRFEKTQFHVWLELPMALPTELTSEHELASILTQRDEIEKFSKRFPNAAPIARKSLDLHGEWCVKIREGMVRHLGEWMPKKAYLDLQAKREAEAQEAKAEAERKQKEIVESEMERKLAEAQQARQRQEAARMAAVDAKKAEIRELQDKISSIEESTNRLIQKLETLAETKP